MATEKRLIFANELLAEVTKVQALEPDKAVVKIIMLITEAESVDAVEVVRCHVCDWFSPECDTCEFWGHVVHPDHFCGEGKRDD